MTSAVRLPKPRDWTLADFLRESLHIEGIHRDPTMAEVAATRRFVRLETVTVSDVVELVTVYAPGHLLRDRLGLNVRVGKHVALAGGPEISEKLAALLAAADRSSPWQTHVDYELLHPFTDGNGRSGRALWLWAHRGHAPLGFLHRFYYESLANQRPA